MVDSRFFPFAGPVRLARLLQDAGLSSFPQAAADLDISGADEPETARPGDVVLAVNKDYVHRLANSRASAVIVSPELADAVPETLLAIVSERAHPLFVALLNALYPDIEAHLTRAAAASGDFVREDNVMIGPGTVIGTGAEIGSGTVIGANCAIGAGVTIGRNAVIADNVSIRCAHIGDRVVLHSGVRIGGAGFGWLDFGRTNLAIPQLGRVIVQDRVEVGANTTVDRGALADTVIGENSKIDNLVQIGHNCQIGRNCLVAAMCGLSGGTVLEDGVLLGGGVGTSGHLRIGANSVVQGRAAVTKDWPAGSQLAGAPAQDVKGFWRELAALRRLGRGGKA